MLNLKSLPNLQKPRERLINEGVQSLSLEEVLSVLVGSGCANNDVLEIARLLAPALLNGNTSLANLQQIPGLGRAKAAIILAALKLPELLLQNRSSTFLDNPQEIYRACQDLLDKHQEHLVVFFLTTRQQAISREVVSIGTATASLLHPREIYRPAISHNASHIVLAHNHPSGMPQPSQADRQVTEKIYQAGKCLGIELLDHVVCARSGYYSFKENEADIFKN